MNARAHDEAIDARRPARAQQPGDPPMKGASNVASKRASKAETDEPRVSRPSLLQRLTFGAWARGSTPPQRPSKPPPSPSRRLVRRALLATFALLILALVPAVARHARATAMLLRLAGSPPSSSQMLENDVVTEEVTIPGAMWTSDNTVGDIPARIYRPAHASIFGKPRGIVLAHGVHYLGIEEPRLVALANALSRSGVAVLTPELAPLADYRVEDPGNLAALRASVHYFASRADVVEEGGVGLMGVSFAGGLSLRVASEREMDSDLAFVVSIGGHHDMRRIARYFVTDEVETPEGETIPWRAHDYGLAVLVYDTPERFVPAADVPVFKTAVRAFLHDSYAEADALAVPLSPEAHGIYESIAHRDTHALAPQVLAAMHDIEGTLMAASPAGHIKDIRVPIYLLHGAHDNVVPPSESRWIAKEAQGHTEVHLLVTTKIGHAELGEDGGVGEELQLVHFMAQLMDD